VLGPAAYREFALPYERAVFEALRERGVPSILYLNGCSHLLEDMASCGAGVLSIDWRETLPSARRRVGVGLGLQGNLDPAALFQPIDAVRRSVALVVDGMRGDPGYIFNLGHGILPETPVESVEALVEVVRGARPGAPNATGVAAKGDPERRTGR
jgi:uroporphyrinogen decarboxylase